MRNWHLALCLLVVVLAVFCDARPTYKRRRSMLRAAKRCLEGDFEMLKDFENDGSLTDDEEQKLKEALGQELDGDESNAELEGLLEFLFELQEDPVAVFKDLEDDDDGSSFKMSPALENIEFKPFTFRRRTVADKKDDKKGDKKGDKKPSKKSFDDLIDMDEKKVAAMAGAVSKKIVDDLIDMDEKKIAAMAGAVSKKIGQKVTPQDVADFLDEYGEEAEEAFYVAAAELNPEDFETFQDLLDHPDLLGDFLEELDNQGLFDKKKKRAFKKSFDDLIDMDEKKIAAMAGAVSKKIGQKVSPQEVAGFLDKYGEEAEEAFYVAAAELNPEDFDTFQDLLDHPDLLGDFLEELDNQGLFDEEEKTSSSKPFDDLIDMDEQKVAAMADAVSKKIGQKVTPQDVADFLDEYGEEAEEAFYIAAAELNPEDFDTFQDLLDHPDLLGDFLEELENQGLLGKKKRTTK